MLRRTAIKKIGLLTGGLFLLPSCNFSDEKAAIVLNRLRINLDQEKLLKAIVSAMIPEGDIIPGAVSLNVHNYVWIMVDDCLTDEKQRIYISGLNRFNGRIIKESGKSYSKLSKNDQINALTEFSNKEDHFITDFINITKYYTGNGYMQSKYIMTEIMPYPLIPGKFDNCEKVDPNKRINIYG
jgi:hypothetical protein